jgi:tetratricopeptide (TPR) repeat protein
MLDARGNPVGTRSSAAVDAAERALWRMMSFYGTPIDDLAAASAADPAWPLPLLMQAGFLLSLTEPSVLAEAGALLERAAPLLPQATAREQAHFQALKPLQAGDWPAACAAWESLLLQHPRDALALQWAHLFDFYRGDALNLRQRVARVLPEWDESDALHPYVLGQYAFGLEECQLYAQAEETGRRALGGAAKVPWAIHAVAHVMEMQGRFDDGTAWMARWHGDWAVGNGFVGHLGWHHALFALEALDTATALQRFDAYLAADPAQITLQRLDASALLWRLHLLGADVGPRWRALADGWARPAAGAGLYPFNDLHLLLALIGAGDDVAARDWLCEVEVRSVQHAGSNRAVAQDVGLPLMRGLLAFAQGRFDDAVRMLYPLRALTHRVGGSHAQRDLIDQTLLAAAARASDKSAGRALLNERRLAKPETPLTAHWAACLG